MKKQKEFELLVKGLALATHHFSLHQVIREEVSESLYGRHKFLLDTIQLGLEQSYLIGLAKFFERPQNPEDLKRTVSIYHFHDFDLDSDFSFGKNAAAEKIKKFRNKVIGHYDRRIIHASFIDGLKVEESETAELFEVAAQAVEKLKQDLGYEWDDHVVTGFPVDKELLRMQLRSLVGDFSEMQNGT